MSGHRAVIDRLHELFNARRFEDLGEVFDENVLMVIEGTSFHGLTQVRDYMAGVVSQIPRMRVEHERVLADSGDTIVTLTRSVETSPAIAGQGERESRPALITNHLIVRRIVAGRIVDYRIYMVPAPGDETSGGSQARLAGIHRLVREQAALLRVAELVARGADTQQVFDAVLVEARGLLEEAPAALWRVEPSGGAAIVAQSADERSADGRTPDVDVTAEHEVVERVIRTRRPARSADLSADVDPDRLPPGLRGGVGAPILVAGRLWGVLAAYFREEPLPGTEERLSRFCELVAAAIANAESRAELAGSEARAHDLAREQAALRRVATLVAEGAGSEQLFAAVAREVADVLEIPVAGLMRFETDQTFVITGVAGETRLGVGTRWPVEKEGLAEMMLSSCGPARKDDYTTLPGPLGEAVRGDTMTATVGVPIVVEGEIWGSIVGAATPGRPIPDGIEGRLARFSELVAVAIANAESRAELTASRARIVASADEARRRLARDVHDGAQQRLVHALIALKQARAALGDSDSAAARLLDESLVQAQNANVQLRELARGILPAALAHGGLSAGVQSLLRDIPFPVEAQVLRERLPEVVETTAYFVIAEALTNVIKHAGPVRVRVRAGIVAERLEVEVADDGPGGADPAGGSGLTGLSDRVEAIGGRLKLSSPPGAGTCLSIALPIEQSPAAQPR